MQSCIRGWVETNLKEGRINGKEKAENIVWHESSICRCDRQQLLQQKGCVIWITGLSGSGKSTVACALSKALFERGKLTYTLDGDNVRHGLNRDLTFKTEDRTENIRRIGTINLLLLTCYNDAIFINQLDQFLTFYDYMR